MKKENIKNRLKGILIILIGLLLAAAGVWLYSKIWGTNLLFTDSSLGKVARFYWIFLIAAVIVVVLGVCKFKKRVVAEPEQETGEQAASQDAGVKPETALQDAEVQTETASQDAGVKPETASAQVEAPKENVQDLHPSQTQSAEKAVREEAKEEAEPAVKEEKTSKKSFMRKKTGNTCPNCGKPISKGNKFCTSCGHKLD